VARLAKEDRLESRNKSSLTATHANVTRPRSSGLQASSQHSQALITVWTWWGFFWGRLRQAAAEDSVPSKWTTTDWPTASAQAREGNEPIPVWTLGRKL